MDLLEDGGYEELNPDSERSVAFYHVATDHTTNITYKQADSDIMQSDGKNEYCLYSFFVELFFGFPASDYEHLIGYVVPGLADVQAQVKCAGSRSETALYYVFLSINVSSLNQVLINDSWTVTVFSENSNSLNFHAYKNISGKIMLLAYIIRKKFLSGNYSSNKIYCQSLFWNLFNHNNTLFLGFIFSALQTTAVHNHNKYAMINRL